MTEYAVTNDRRFRALIEHSLDAVGLLDADGIIRYESPAVTRMLGYTPEELLGRSVFGGVHPEDQEYARSLFAERLESPGSINHSELRYRHRDGSWRWIEVVATNLLDEPDIRGIVLNYRDVTDRRTADQAREEAVRRHEDTEARLMLLSGAAEALLGELDAGRLVPAVLELSRKLFAADAYAVWRRRADGDWAVVTQFGLPADYPLTTGVMGANARIPDAPYSIEDVDTEPLVATRREAYRREGIRALLFLPLTLHGERSGTITFYYRQPHRANETEIRVGSALANLAAAALTNAELYAEQRRMRQTAETAQQRLLFLAQASSILASSLDYRTTLDHVARLAVPHLADWCVVTLANGDGSVEPVAVAHTDPQRTQFALDVQRRYPYDPNQPGGLGHVLRTGEAIFEPDVTDEMVARAARDEEHLRVLREIGLRSVMVVPLTARGRVLGAISFVASEPGARFAEGDLSLAHDLARRAAVAIENARLYEASREAESALRETEERLRLAVQSAAIGTWDLNAVTGELRWSDRCKGIFGLPPTAEIDYDVFVAGLHPEDRERTHAVVEAALDPSGSGAYEVEYRTLWPDGTIRWVAAKGRAFFTGADGGRRAVRFIGTVVDVTERKEAEIALRRQARLSALRAEIGGAIARGGELPGVLQACAEALVRHLDVAFARIWTLNAAERMLELQASAGLYTHLNGAHSRIPLGAMKIGRIAERREPYLTNDLANDDRITDAGWARAEGMVGFAGHPLLVEDRVAGVMAMFAREPLPEDLLDTLAAVADVIAQFIERKRAEDEVRCRAEELAEANERKDQFLTMLAHELRNPLGAVSNALHVLGISRPNTPAYDRAWASANRQVQHQARLVEDLLDVSRITRGRLELRKEHLDLARLVRETAADYRSGMERAGVTLTVSVPESAVSVVGDRTRLAQVLGNLLDNAAKFTPSGGSVQVTLTIEGEREAERATLSVRDTGIGIEPKILPHVFDPFMQADRSLDRSRGGLGLGLALVKGLVELHDGTVRAASRGPGHGAELTAFLPLDAASPMAVSTSGAEAAGTELRVLIIEDNVDAAETLRDLLELFGHEAHVAADGHQGLEAASRMCPDVILCDIGLPGMDGYELAQALRQNGTAGARLVAVTGYGGEDARRRSREAGFEVHLTKPVNVDELRRTLEELSHARPE